MNSTKITYYQKEYIVNAFPNIQTTFFTELENKMNSKVHMKPERFIIAEEILSKPQCKSHHNPRFQVVSEKQDGTGTKIEM